MTKAYNLPLPDSQSNMRLSLNWLQMLPLAILMLAQVGLFIWMSRRGFEFTDESFYFLHYLYWRDLIGTVTFFGAYFEWPFRILGQSIAAMRVFGLVLLLASSAFFAREVLCFSFRRDGVTGKLRLEPIFFTGATTSLFYFGYLSTLRAPSYNLLALCAMLVATTLLLRLLARSSVHPKERLVLLCYGLVTGACGLAKPTTGLLLVLMHAAFFSIANSDWRLRRVLTLFTFVLAGIGLNFIVMQWLHPRLLDALGEGLALAKVTGSHSFLSLARDFRWELRKMLPIILMVILGTSVIAFLLARLRHTLHRMTLSILIVAQVAVCVAGLIYGPERWWLLFLGQSVFLLWIVERLFRTPGKFDFGDLTDLALMGLLFVLPVAFSFGTNMPVMEHSELAAVIPVTALLVRLARLTGVGILSPAALATCLAVLCLPTLVIQIRSATDVHHTYRQLSALGEQAIPVQLGAAGNTLLVDAETRETLQSIIGSARAVGFLSGQTILDFTGDGPGLIYALGGRPLGLAWLLGGYPGSQALAAKVVDNLTVGELQNAWLLSSDNNPRAIKDWQNLLNAKLEIGTHELVATVNVHASYRYVPNAPDRQTVQIWKPRNR
jgi:hypothetical protein